MPVTVADKRVTFRKMHQTGCFVLPNPWDAGSARALQHLGFKAVASTSAGFAWSIGKSDNRVTLEDVLRHLTDLCEATDLPGLQVTLFATRMIPVVVLIVTVNGLPAVSAVRVNVLPVGDAAVCSAYSGYTVADRALYAVTSRGRNVAIVADVTA